MATDRWRCALHGLLSHIFLPLLVGIPFITAGGLMGRADLPKSPPASPEPRQAMWGFVTTYADAIAVDSPIRQIRNALYDAKSGEAPLSEESTRRTLTYAPTHDHTTDLDLTGSSAVIVGNVIRAHSYLSNDKTGIYTELSVKVQQVLQNTSDPNLVAGSKLDIIRAGGLIRLPSGRLLLRGCQEEPIPAYGVRYLFVLAYSQSATAFRLLRAFELAGPTVYVLDSVHEDVSSGSPSQGSRQVRFVLTAYPLSTDQFIQAVTQAVANSFP